jgi:hypothetical protein
MPKHVSSIPLVTYRLPTQKQGGTLIIAGQLQNNFASTDFTLPENKLAAKT